MTIHVIGLIYILSAESLKPEGGGDTTKTAQCRHWLGNSVYTGEPIMEPNLVSMYVSNPDFIISIVNRHLWTIPYIYSSTLRARVWFNNKLTPDHDDTYLQ